MKRKHMDHIAEKGYVESFHYGLVHKLVSIQEGMKIPDATAAVDKEWDKLKNIPAWDVKKARSQAEVVIQAKMNAKTVHFANLMDLCNLKNAGLAKHLQKNKARVVLREDNVKDEEGYRAVFTEQGGSASQMAAAKFLDTISKLPSGAGESSNSVSRTLR